MASLRSLNRALALLDHLAEHHGRHGGQVALRVADVADLLGVDKSTASRLAATLEARGYLQRDPVSRRYALGAKVRPAAPPDGWVRDLVQRAGPVVADLADVTGECAHVAVLDGGAVRIVEDVVARAEGLQVRAGVGRSMPLHCTALGKCFLAFTDVERPPDLVAFTPHTVTDASDLARHLEAVRRAGYALDDEEHEPGVRCLAVPVRDAAGGVVASLGISAPRLRLHDEDLAAVARSVHRAAADLTRALDARRPSGARPDARRAGPVTNP
ncbi:MAG: IclR family transcriptional regulator [Trueperaceae bacterium]|nr:IclR family transcriptional regulator [Trueperaceae bacterium]